jgi:hypothetical protein
MAISNSSSIFNPAQQSSGFTNVPISNGGIGLSSATQAAHYQSEMTAYYDKHTNIRITHVENGFIVEVGSEARLTRKYVAKDMDEVRDLITSDMVTQRMEGK